MAAAAAAAVAPALLGAPAVDFARRPLAALSRPPGAAGFTDPGAVASSSARRIGRRKAPPLPAAALIHAHGELTAGESGDQQASEAAHRARGGELEGGQDGVRRDRGDGDDGEDDEADNGETLGIHFSHGNRPPFTLPPPGATPLPMADETPEETSARMGEEQPPEPEHGAPGGGEQPPDIYIGPPFSVASDLAVVEAEAVVEDEDGNQFTIDLLSGSYKRPPWDEERSGPRYTHFLVIAPEDDATIVEDVSAHVMYVNGIAPSSPLVDDGDDGDGDDGGDGDE